MYKFVQRYFSKMFRETPSGIHSRQWSMMKRLFQLRNWDLLGVRLRRITRNVLCGDEQALLELYTECLIHIKEDLDPYILVEIVEVIVRAMSIENKPLEMLFNLYQAVDSNVEAMQYVRILQGHLLLQKYCDIKAAKEIVEELKMEIDETGCEKDARNYCKYHVLLAAYYFLTEQWSKSYCSRMKYLSCGLKSYPKGLWPEQAYLLVINALLVEDKYEFEDVQKHHTMETLRSDSREWALDVLSAFRTGNLERFRKLRYYWMRAPELYNNADALYQRIYVIVFLTLVAQRYTLPCFIHFVELAMELCTAAADVVKVVRRAINTGLVDAKINLLSEVVEIYSLKPISFSPYEIPSELDNCPNDLKDLELWLNDGD